MRKLFLIIQREYFSRVKKKSFIIMTLLAPVLLGGISVLPVWLAMQEHTEHKIQVIDQSGAFVDQLPNNPQISFSYTDQSLEQAKKALYKSPYDIIMVIPREILNSTKAGPILYYRSQPGISTEQYISNTLENMLFDYRLQGDSIDISKLDKARRHVAVSTIKVNETGKDEKTNTSTNMAIGYAFALIIYLMIFLYGAQVMRGVIEEKSNRIIELMISSVKPFQLMLGKILGVALVGLTQFLAWIILTVIISGALSGVVLKDAIADKAKHEAQMEKAYKDDLTANLDKVKPMNTRYEALQLLAQIDRVDKNELLGCFAFYFLFGYLLYAGLFAAIGSAVDNDADTQQFMLPVTIPLIFSFVISFAVMSEPDGMMARVFSMIPLTSPIVMMVRMPFGVSAWEVAVSMLLLLAGFFFFTWLAGKIYRTGILMYGKKASWKELGKWLFYKS
ncbi:MAG: ABC transporter permease [Bacteroidetes bacterium]|nr:ABC transporter permease [Bacteroidota bacterium]